MINFIKYFLMFLLLLLLQRFVFDNIFIQGIERPLIFFFFILVLPRMQPWAMLLIGFLTGFFYDIMYHTPGIHAAACVALAFIRDGIMKQFLNDESEDDYSAHISNLGFSRFFFFILICSVIFHLIVTLLNAFSFNNLAASLLNVVLNTASSVILIYIFDIIFYYRKGAV